MSRASQLGRVAAAVAAAGAERPMTLEEANDALRRQQSLIYDIQADLKEALASQAQQRIQLTELLRRHAWMQEEVTRAARARDARRGGLSGGDGDSGGRGRGGGSGAGGDGGGAGYSDPRGSRSEGGDGGGGGGSHRDEEFMSLPSDDDGGDARGEGGMGPSGGTGSGGGGASARLGADDTAARRFEVDVRRSDHRCVSDVMVTFLAGPTGLALAPTPAGIGYAVEIEYFPLVRRGGRTGVCVCGGGDKRAGAGRWRAGPRAALQ